MARKIPLLSGGAPPNLRIDRVSTRGSIYDMISAVTGQQPKHAVQTFSRLCRQFPDIEKRVVRVRINGSGRLTPVADPSTLIETAYVLPGKVATAFRRSSAAMVCRMLGGDLSIIAEIEHRHVHLAASSERAFLSGTSDQHSASKICARSLLWDEAKFDILAEVAAKEDLRGSVYLVTSPAVNVVKIGMWRGTIPELSSRYVTYYGQDIRLWAFEADNCVSAERDCHQALSSFRISNELFRPGPENVEQYLRTIKELCRECLVCPT